MPTKKIIKTRKTASRKPRSKRTPSIDFEGAFDGLKKILQHHAAKFFVKKDEPRQYYVETLARNWKGQRMFFGAVMIKKNYVSFHLMPIYISPELLQTISPELKRRMQGKACFNFTSPDPDLFAQLAKLTQAGCEKYQANKFL